MPEDILGGNSDVVGESAAAIAAERARAESAESALTAAKVSKPVPPGTYTQTFSTAARVHVEGELSTNVSATLVSELDTQLNTTNKAVNEIKKLINALIDDSQSVGIAK